MRQYIYEDELPEMTKEELKKNRIRLDLTQAEMAEKMGLSLRGYQDKEYGKRPITKQDEIILKILKKNQNYNYK